MADDMYTPPPKNQKTSHLLSNTHTVGEDLEATAAAAPPAAAAVAAPEPPPPGEAEEVAPLLTRSDN